MTSLQVSRSNSVLKSDGNKQKANNSGFSCKLPTLQEIFKFSCYKDYCNSTDKPMSLEELDDFVVKQIQQDNFNAQNHEIALGDSLLTCASCLGLENVVTHLVTQENLDININNKKSHFLDNALELAAGRGFYRIVETLLAKGAFINRPNFSKDDPPEVYDFYCRPLDRAVTMKVFNDAEEENKIKTIEVLVKYIVLGNNFQGYTEEEKIKQREIILSRALFRLIDCDMPNLKIVKYLISNGANELFEFISYARRYVCVKKNSIGLAIEKLEELKKYNYSPRLKRELRDVVRKWRDVVVFLKKGVLIEILNQHVIIEMTSLILGYTGENLKIEYHNRRKKKIIEPHGQVHPPQDSHEVSPIVNITIEENTDKSMLAINPSDSENNSANPNEVESSVDVLVTNADKSNKAQKKPLKKKIHLKKEKKKEKNPIINFEKRIKPTQKPLQMLKDKNIEKENKEKAEKVMKFQEEQIKIKKNLRKNVLKKPQSGNWTLFTNVVQFSLIIGTGIAFSLFQLSASKRSFN